MDAVLSSCPQAHWLPKNIQPAYCLEVWKIMITRRHFSKLLMASPLLASANPARAEASSVAMPQDMGRALSQSRDLLIKGGTVVDPSQNLHALLDVAVTDGKVVQIAPDIPADGSRALISAKGKIVTPGLIDVHVHIFEGVG